MYLYIQTNCTILANTVKLSPMIFLYLYNTHIDIIIDDKIKSLPLHISCIISLAPELQYRVVSWFTISISIAQYQLCHVLIPVILTQIRGGIRDKMTYNHT